MSVLKGKNSMKARKLYLSRTVYNGKVLQKLRKVNEITFETEQIKDFLQDEHLLIGRVNQDNDPIFPRSTFLRPFTHTPSGDITALNFVVDSFEDMKKKFDRSLMNGHLAPDTEALSNLEVVRAYTSPMKAYNKHVGELRNTFKAFAMRKNRINKISDFDSFVPVFMEFVERVAPDFPITKSMYFISRQVSPLTSGIALETFHGNYGDDEKKVKLFYQQRNFEFFKNLAYSYGFMIDKHIPWRLIADLNSPRMAPYIKNSLNVRYPSANVVLAQAFGETYSDDIPSIIRMAQSFYNTVVTHRPRTRILSPGKIGKSTVTSPRAGCKEVKIINRAPITARQLGSLYDTGFWLNMYTRIRNVETNMFYKEELVQDIVERSIDLVNKLDRPQALRYIIAKFDNVEHYEGSLFHDVSRIRMSKASDDATESEVTETVRRSVQASNFIVY